MYWNLEDRAAELGVKRLIETWDVLKQWNSIREQMKRIGLIETWDVLKLRPTSAALAGSPWLIETWDVLKPDWPYQYAWRSWD